MRLKNKFGKGYNFNNGIQGNLLHKIQEIQSNVVLDTSSKYIILYKRNHDVYRNDVIKSVGKFIVIVPNITIKYLPLHNGLLRLCLNKLGEVISQECINLAEARAGVRSQSERLRPASSLLSALLFR